MAKKKYDKEPVGWFTTRSGKHVPIFAVEFNGEMTEAEFKEYTDRKVEPYIEQFIDEHGLGPCGPVADNLVDKLQAAGYDARVMNGVYAPGGVADYSKGFGHYVAVIMKNGKPDIIFDPTNAFSDKKYFKLTNGVLPKEWTVFDTDEPFIGDKNYRSTDDEIFTEETVKWWKDKL